MVSMRTDRIMLGVFVVGLLTATAACALHPQTGRTPDTKPSPTAGEPSPAKTVPVVCRLRPSPGQPQERPPSPAVLQLVHDRQTMLTIREPLSTGC
jgi:hypothetical protein